MTVIRLGRGGQRLDTAKPAICSAGKIWRWSGPWMEMLDDEQTDKLREHFGERLDAAQVAVRALG